MERDRVRKRERKALLKSLQMAQMSTASMGKFDKNVNKYEPDAPKGLKVQKKKSNAKLATSYPMIDLRVRMCMRALTSRLADMHVLFGPLRDRSASSR